MKIRRSMFLPPLLLIMGIAFYVYYGISYNAWQQNLYNIIAYVVIIALLFWALRKKEQLQDKRNNNQ